MAHLKKPKKNHLNHYKLAMILKPMVCNQRDGINTESI